MVNRRWAIAGTVVVVAVAVGAAPVALGQIDSGGAAPDSQQPGRQAPVQELVALASAANVFEIRASRVAVRRARWGQVRDLARDLLRDHRRLQRELLALGAQLAIPVGRTLSQRQRRDLSRLRRRRGDRFDRLFLGQQTTAHRQARDLHLRLALGAFDERLRAYAIRALPLIGRHHGEADALESVLEDEGLEPRR
jgi:putative membrane protein